MKEYHKIQSIYKRDAKTNRFIIGEYSLPEFAYLADNQWTFTEKVDGTNVRVMLKEGKLHFGGKTDNAQMPIPLLEKLNDLFPPEKLFEQFPERTDVCLYGEGFGAGIQKGGCYGSVNFVLFDVRIGDFWLRRDDVNEIAEKLGIQRVPIIGDGTLHDGILHAKMGLKSSWGDFEAEGIVARPTVELFTRNGSRIIVKIKTKDFK